MPRRVNFDIREALMSETRINGALDRIEKALARIETQAALHRRGATEDAQLSQRHEALKSRVAANLGELDKLIGSLEL